MPKLLINQSINQLTETSVMNRSFTKITHWIKNGFVEFYCHKNTFLNSNSKYL